MLTAMFRRAFGGSIARKLRAVLPDLALKGEKEVVIEVRKRVIIVAIAVFEEGAGRGLRGRGNRSRDVVCDGADL